MTPTLTPERTQDVLYLLDEIYEFLDNYVDVVDGEDSQPRPNRAMSLQSSVDEMLALLRGERWPR